MIPEEEILMLESLIKSPAFGALKRMVGRYRATTLSDLYTKDLPHELHRAQGVLMGLGVVENLPDMLVKERLNKIAEEQKLKEKFKPKKPEDFTPQKP